MIYMILPDFTLKMKKQRMVITTDARNEEEEDNRNEEENHATDADDPLSKVPMSTEVAVAVNSEKSKPKQEKLPKPSVRFDGNEHFINFDDPNGKRKGFKCKREGCGQATTVFCEKCKVHLCFVTGKKGRNCFKRFHILAES